MDKCKRHKTFPSVWKLRGYNSAKLLGSSGIEMWCVRLTSTLCVAIETNAPNMISELRLWLPSAYVDLIKVSKSKPRSVEGKKRKKLAQKNLRYCNGADGFFNYRGCDWVESERVELEEGQRKLNAWLLLKNL